MQIYLFSTCFSYRYSGIKREQVESNSALTYGEAQRRVENHLKDNLIVGSSLYNDYSVLKIDRNRYTKHTIDVSQIQPIRYLMGQKGHFRRGPFGLKHMAKELLGSEIQNLCHCSVEDASAAMKLFQLVEETFVKENYESMCKFFEKRKKSKEELIITAL